MEIANDNRKNILILDDDPAIREEIREAFVNENFCVYEAGSEAQLRDQVSMHDIDLYLLDLGLPDSQGLSLAAELRAQTSAGVIVVTGRSSEMDRVLGLELGADDYLTKPFSVRELVARANSVLRRLESQSHETVPESEKRIFDGWTLNTAARYLSDPSGTEIKLTSAEYNLLYAFISNTQRVLSRDQLIEKVYGSNWAGYDRNIDGLISRLRRKLKRPKNETELIKTVRGVGYMFTTKIAE